MNDLGIKVAFVPPSASTDRHGVTTSAFGCPVANG